jgi:hypothetical protein
MKIAIAVALVGLVGCLAPMYQARPGDPLGNMCGNQCEMKRELERGQLTAIKNDEELSCFKACAAQSGGTVTAGGFLHHGDSETFPAPAAQQAQQTPPPQPPTTQSTPQDAGSWGKW